MILCEALIFGKWPRRQRASVDRSPCGHTCEKARLIWSDAMTTNRQVDQWWFYRSCPKHSCYWCHIALKIWCQLPLKITAIFVLFEILKTHKFLNFNTRTVFDKQYLLKISQCSHSQQSFPQMKVINNELKYKTFYWCWRLTVLYVPLLPRPQLWNW